MARVLVVEDKDGVRSFVAEALELDGHDVDVASDGQMALDALAAKTYSVVLTDLKMPRIDGMELLRRIQKMDPPPQVIVLTAYGSIHTAVEAMKNGALDYLTKPLDSIKELRALVKRAAERDELLTGEVQPIALDNLTVLRRSNGPTLSWGAPAMKPVLQAMSRVAPAPTSVLLFGESGVGKEVLARRIHSLSPRHKAPFIAINCAALAESLFESELFGHEKGAFTGATTRRIGRIEQARGGTLFLDEIGEMRLELQAKLLRVIEQKKLQRVGGAELLDVDVRWIAATNRDLREMVSEGTFRGDLYHRLAVFPIQIPPLRRRREDIIPMARALVKNLGKDFGNPNLHIAEEALEELRGQRWPGNVRELRNAIERASLMAQGDAITTEHFRDAERAAHTSVYTEEITSTTDIYADDDGEIMSLQEIEKQAIIRTLKSCDGNRKQAAQKLGIGVRTLYDKLKRYDIN